MQSNQINGKVIYYISEKLHELLPYYKIIFRSRNKFKYTIFCILWSYTYFKKLNAYLGLKNKEGRERGINRRKHVKTSGFAQRWVCNIT